MGETETRTESDDVSRARILWGALLVLLDRRRHREPGVIEYERELLAMSLASRAYAAALVAAGLDTCAGWVWRRWSLVAVAYHAGRLMGRAEERARSTD